MSCNRAPGHVHAVTAVDSSGETAKQAAESKKWLAIAALIPDQPQPQEPPAAVPHEGHHPHPPLPAGSPLRAPVSVRQLDEPQLTPASDSQPKPSYPATSMAAASPCGLPTTTASAHNRIANPPHSPTSKDTAHNSTASHSGISSSKDMPPEQPPKCSRESGSTKPILGADLESPSSAPATEEPTPSCRTDMRQDPTIPSPAAKPDWGPEQAQPLPVQGRAEGQRTVSDQQSPSCGRLTPSDAEACLSVVEAPTRAEGKA